eukprot:356613-Chlamydomonas_euryale.AAC.2
MPAHPHACAHSRKRVAARCAVGAADGALYVWDICGGGPPTVLRHHRDAVVAATFSCDVSVLVTADKGGHVALWSLLGDS